MGVAACHHEGEELEEGPSTRKHSGGGTCPGQRIAWAHSSMQGWRKTMEDAHIAVASLGKHVANSSKSKVQSSQAETWNGTALFGVMDGHGGTQVARFCERYLPGAIVQAGRLEDASAALPAAFQRMDELLWDSRCLRELKELGDKKERGGPWSPHPFAMGCTANVCCVQPEALLVANAGDCRAVLCRNGVAVDLSEDHKPENPRENARIRRAGGWVEMEQHGRSAAIYRVNGDLSLSRAIGDLEYKQNKALEPGEQVISAVPDVRRVARERGDEFLIIACDGVWDVITSQEAVNFVRLRLGRREEWPARLAQGSLDLRKITEALLDACLSPDLDQTDGLGGDNMTAVLVVFLPHEPTAMTVVPVQLQPAVMSPVLVAATLQPATATALRSVPLHPAPTASLVGSPTASLAFVRT